MPPFASLQPLTGAPDPEASSSELEEKIERLKLDGNNSFRENRFKEALDAYSSAIKLAQDCKDNAFNPLLLTNRATVYIKLKQYEDDLKDANDYITRRPNCWRGYARKALALDGLNEKVSAEIAAALAFYYNRAIFSDFSLFEESFCDLQKRIFVCDTVYQLISNAELCQKEETDLHLIFVLGSKDYVLNSDIVGGDIFLRNCILVGARINSSVVLKFKNNKCIFLFSKCMITNLSFYLEEGQVCGKPGSVVKVLNCNFTGKDNDKSMVASEGEFNAERCNFTNSNHVGLACVGPGNMVVVNSSFCDNVGALAVKEGGTLVVKSSRMYNNRMRGLEIGPEVSNCVVINCDVHHNGQDGIIILHSTNLSIIRNNVFDNEDNGLYILNSDAVIRENNIFDNGTWGIWSQSNSWCSISMNRIFRNKVGGIRVGYRAAGKEFTPSVVELNKIYDNIGPGFVEIVHQFEVGGSRTTNVDLRKSYLVSPNSLQSAKCQHNEMYNNKERENVGTLNFSIPYCSNCRTKCELQRCGKCFTAAYCNKTWHKKIEA